MERSAVFRVQKRVAGLLLAAAVAAASACPAFAGAWSARSPEGQVTGKTYYIGDNGTYVRSAWVYVNDVWYWLQGDGSLPSAYGISSDGYIFNEKGIYVPSITGQAGHYWDQTLYPAGGTAAGSAVSSGGYSNPVSASGSSGAAASSGQIQGVSYNPPSYSYTQRGPGGYHSGGGYGGYKPSNYGPGAGYVSDPHQ